MAYPGEHYYLAIYGTLQGAEQWSIGLRLTTGGLQPVQGAEQAACDALYARFEQWWTTQTIISAGAAWSGLKFNRIGPAGRYAAPYTNRKDRSGPLNGAGTIKYPHQVAQVATLETAVQRGLAARGRVFLPSPAAALSTDGRTSQATAAATASAVKSLLDSINAEPSTGQIVVASAVGAGMLRAVTGVGVGRVLDTMRSRRAQLLEARESTALAVVP